METKNDACLKETLEKKAANDSIFWCSKKRLSDIEVRMKNSSKIQLIKRKEDILTELSEMKNEVLKQLESTQMEAIFVVADKNLVIPYKTWTFVLDNVKKLVETGFVKFSDPLVDDYESIWKMVFKVKENGKELHVALELSGIEANYEYFIEIVHDDPEKSLKFLKNVQHFDLSHPLYWRKLVNIDELMEDRFFSGSNGDCLTFRLFLRPCNVFEKCKIQEKYIEILKGGKGNVKKENALVRVEESRQKSVENIQICGE